MRLIQAARSAVDERHNHRSRGETLLLGSRRLEVPKKAVTDLGYRHGMPVIHEIAWREREPGFRSNDLENENAQLKRWLPAQ